MTHDHASSSKSQNSPPSGVVPRFVRSFSKGTTSTSPTTRADAPSPSVSDLPKAKVIAIDRLLKYARREKFPSSSLFGQEGHQVQETTPITASLPATSIINNEIQEAGSSAADYVSHSGSEEESEPPEPVTLAHRIQAMIALLPSLPSGPFTPSSQPHPTLAETQAIDTCDGAPNTPLESPITDSKLKTLLTSFPIMNGSIERGRESVWSVLDRLRSPRSKGNMDSEPNEVLHPGAEYEDDNGSVMMYGPLEPTEDSEIEIARSEIVSLNGDGEEIRTPQLSFVPLPSESIEQVLSQSDSRRKGKQREDPEQIASTSRVPTEATTSGTSSEPPVEYRVWLPSLTKISIQAMWWGFRMYGCLLLWFTHETHLLFSVTFRLPFWMLLIINSSRLRSVLP